MGPILHCSSWPPFANAIPRLYMLAAPSQPVRAVQPQAAGPGGAAQLPSGSLGWPIRTCSCKPRLKYQKVLTLRY
ncbi:MAG: hypothetical protein LBU32_24720 [Clostridiales bacterium]|nr:hypothetical protein [Clostridiales bacterium]